MDGSPDNLPDASDEYYWRQSLKWFEPEESPQTRRKQAKSPVQLREQYNGDDPHAVSDPYLLYQNAISVATRVDQFFEQRFKSRAIELVVGVMEAVAELGTVLLSLPAERSSSSAACLTRAFAKISATIEMAEQLERQKILSTAGYRRLSALLFEVRDGIVVLCTLAGSARG